MWVPWLNPKPWKTAQCCKPCADWAVDHFFQVLWGWRGRFQQCGIALHSCREFPHPAAVPFQIGGLRQRWWSSGGIHGWSGGKSQLGGCLLSAVAVPVCSQGQQMSLRALAAAVKMPFNFAVLVRPQKLDRQRVDITYNNCVTTLRMSEQYNIELCLFLNIKLRFSVFFTT